MPRSRRPEAPGWRRAAKSGITGFDVYHPKDRRGYVNKNNLNLVTRVPGKGWQNGSKPAKAFR